MNPEEFQSFSTEQRQIQQIWNNLQEIIAKYPAGNTTLSRYLFGDSEHETDNSKGSRVDIYYTKDIENPAEDQESDGFYIGFVYSETTDGFEKLNMPFFEIHGHASRTGYATQTPFGVIPDRVIDATDTLFFSTNAYVIDSSNQAFKHTLTTSEANIGSLEKQLALWGLKQEDVSRTDKHLSATDQLFNISGSDLEQINYLLSLINTGELVRLPNPKL